MIKLVIFDMDGTLLDSMWVWRGAAERYLVSIGKPCNENLSHLLDKMTMKSAIDYLKENYLPELPWEEIDTGVRSQIAGAYMNVCEKKGATALLKKLRREGIRTVLATASPEDVVMNVISRLGITELFDKVVTEAVKSTPDLFLQLADGFFAKPNEVIVAEDALYSIRTAHSAGFKIMGVYEEYFKERQEEIKKLSDLYYTKIDNTDSIIEDIKSL